MKRASILLITDICGETKIEAASVKIDDVEISITDGTRKCQLVTHFPFLHAKTQDDSQEVKH